MADHPLAGPIYTRPPDPKSCTVCPRKGVALENVLRGAFECSHVDCPHRARVTAQPMSRYFKEQLE